MTWHTYIGKGSGSRPASAGSRLYADQNERDHAQLASAIAASAIAASAIAASAIAASAIAAGAVESLPG